MKISIFQNENKLSEKSGIILRFCSPSCKKLGVCFYIDLAWSSMWLYSTVHPWEGMRKANNILVLIGK